MQRAGVAVVLLKGPSIASWLYGPEEPRWYNDCDLLVRERDLVIAGGVLEGLEYRRRPNPPDDPALLADVHSIVWTRAHDDAAVELHWTLVGLAASPQLVWDTLSGETVPVTVDGVGTRALGEAARALHLALHLAQHGCATPQPTEDLRRGIERLEYGVWLAARARSARLGGDSAFAAGLRALPSGAELAARLALPPAETYWTMRAQSAPRGALRLRQLRDAHGWRERWLFLSEGLSRYREFSKERHVSGLARLRSSATDLVAAVRALRRSN